MSTGISKSPDSRHWRQLYRAALSEIDKSKLPERIAEAEKAVVLRASRARSPVVNSKAYSSCMDRDAILKRITELRDEIDLVVRENRAYDAYYTHTVKEQHLYVTRMQRLEQIKTELDDMKAGKFHETDRSSHL